MKLASEAVKKGISEIGFSEHAPMIKDDWDDWHMKFEDMNLYIQSIKKAQIEHPNLCIKYGLEVDYIPGHEAWIYDLTKMYNWDYLIGSVHYVSDDFDIDNPHKLHMWKGSDVDEIWRLYFDRLRMAVGSGLFQIIGHADLCKKFGFFPKGKVEAEIQAFLETARDRSVAIEINTSGLRKACREIYPSASILKMASEMKIGLSFGSDAHNPEEVGMNFGEAVSLARSVGYKHFCRFHKRECELIPL